MTDPAQPQPTPDPEKIDRAAPRININPDNVKTRDSIKKPYLNAVVMGHVSSGKSTVSGRFVYECDGIDEDLMTKFEREANQVMFRMQQNLSQLPSSLMTNGAAFTAHLSIYLHGIG